MFKQLIDFIKRSFVFQHEQHKIKEDLVALQKQLNETNETLRELAAEVQRLGAREQSEREKLVLQLENTLLRAQLKLPAAKDSHGRKG